MTTTVIESDDYRRELTERLAESLAVCEDATWGPWQVLKERVVTEDMDMVTPRLHSAPDAEFIAHARTGYPAALKALQAVMEIHRPSVKWYPGSNQRVELCRSDEEHWPCPTVAAITKHLGGAVEEDQQERKGSIMDYAGIWGPRPEGLDVVEWQREMRDE